MEINAVDKFKEKSILVIGDIMIDRYLYGQTTRISPEAPVPVVRILSVENILGGAGNVANNLVSLGSKVALAGVVGADNEGKILLEILKKKGIIPLLVEDNTRPTTVKQRVVSGNNYQMLRMDYEKTAQIDEEIQKVLFNSIKKKISDFDAIAISDYDKGIFTEKFSRNIMKLCLEKNKPVIVDTKPCHIMYFKNCTIITPNLKEAMEMTGSQQDVVDMGKKLVDMLNCNVFITRGQEGISVFDRKAMHFYVPQMAITKIFDVTGAGDTVCAIALLSLVSGLSLIDSAKLANYGAGLVVQKPGTSTVTTEELKNVFRQEISHYLKESIEVKQKVIEKQLDKIEKAAQMFVEAYSSKNKVIAFGNGGSASDAQHLVGELVGRFKAERKGLAAMSLTTDSSVVTAIANDYGYDMVFERQVEANAVKGDVVFGISTSGNSPNVINAIKKAREMGCKTIGLTGKEGGELAKVCDIAIIVPSNNTPRIQEAHISIIHIICELLDKELTKNA
jgi:phosphoheptose isomerase